MALVQVQLTQAATPFVQKVFVVEQVIHVPPVDGTLPAEQAAMCGYEWENQYKRLPLDGWKETNKRMVPRIRPIKNLY